jgi:hypothetical protein
MLQRIIVWTFRQTNVLRKINAFVFSCLKNCILKHKIFLKSLSKEKKHTLLFSLKIKPVVFLLLKSKTNNFVNVKNLFFHLMYHLQEQKYP